jgi:thioredoxin-dependent peroxiredoxin
MARWILAVVVVAILALAVPRFLAAGPIPTVGTAAPDFELRSQEGTPVKLSEFRGKWVVLYFYPKDQTPGCTREAHNFQRDQAQYDQRKAVVLGVSVDNVDSHKAFCTKESLTFKLLADTDKTVTDTYGSLMAVVKIAKRHTFLIDPDGKIRKVYTDVDPAKHSEEVLAALAELQK